jgi:hypothetical protein
VCLLLGIIPLLIVAGTVEGFISPTDLAARWKYLLGVALFGLLIFFLMKKNPQAGKRETPFRVSSVP